MCPGVISNKELAALLENFDAVIVENLCAHVVYLNNPLRRPVESATESGRCAARLT